MKGVVKFGGNPLASAGQFREIADIIRTGKSRRYVVPSAPGKRDDKDRKVTDILYVCYDAVMGGRSYKEILKKIKNKYLDIIDGPNLNLGLNHEFERIEEDFLVEAGRGYAASRGECLSSIVTANYLGCEFIDAIEVIFFDDNGNPEADLTSKELSERPKRVERAVIPGFYGSKHDDMVKTFSGGDSDVTSSVMAKAIHAGMYESWTDVSGVLVTDPRIVGDPEMIEAITYKELRELSYMGANILHEDTILPARREGTPINIRNTDRSEGKGTLIMENIRRKPRHTIIGVAGKKGFCSINTGKAMTSAEAGFGRKMLNVFKQYSIPFEHMPFSIDTMMVYVYQSESEGCEQSMITGIHRVVELNTVELESGPTLTAVVDRGMRLNRGTMRRVFSTLVHARVNIKMVGQGSSEWNITIGMKNDDFETAIRAIYDIFVITEL